MYTAADRFISMIYNCLTTHITHFDLSYIYTNYTGQHADQLNTVLHTLQTTVNCYIRVSSEEQTQTHIPEKHGKTHGEQNIISAVYNSEYKLA